MIPKHKNTEKHSSDAWAVTTVLTYKRHVKQFLSTELRTISVILEVEYAKRAFNRTHDPRLILSRRKNNKKISRELFCQVLELKKKFKWKIIAPEYFS